MNKRTLLLIASMALMAGCAHRQPLGGPGVIVASMTSLPVPAYARDAGASRPYFLGPLDRVQVDVFGIESLHNMEIRIDGSGRFAVPMAGTIDARGKTAEDVAREIRKRLVAAYVRNPQVTVNLVEPLSQVVTVDGQVAKPGLYPVAARTTLMRAIASAGGGTENSALDDVVILRTVDGQRYAGLFNLGSIRRGGYPDPEIFAEDVIIVGDSPSRRMFRDILAASPLITTPLILLVQRL